MHDLIIRGGTVIDGTGRPGFEADIAVDGARITQIGVVDGLGRRELDARDHIVTPGFVDIHTHYDGQLTWDAMMAPSSDHGVTSILVGNCGVGFAPVRPDHHEFLITMMEGVEDIPGSALHEGLRWDWESFPEYMDALERTAHVIDFGVQVPHAPLRAYVMGLRGGDHEAVASADDIAQMARLVEEAIRAGATGFATSRMGHRSGDGSLLGTTRASTDELYGIGRALAEAGAGVIQVSGQAQTPAEAESEFAIARGLAEASGRPLSCSIFQSDQAPNWWRTAMARIEEAASDGIDMKAQVCLRPPSLLHTLQGSKQPFSECETFQQLRGLSLSAQLDLLRREDVRQAIINEHLRQRGGSGSLLPGQRNASAEKLFLLGDPPDYEPGPEQSCAAQAHRRDVTESDVLFDWLLERNGTGIIYQPIMNYTGTNLDAARAMALSERALLGLSDGGAHVGYMCDASFPTYNLSYWCRDRTRGKRFALEAIVKRQSADTAAHVGWRDRGVLAPGYKADLNVIDADTLSLDAPRLVADLPAGGQRFLQRAVGYAFTVCSGEVTFDQGAPTGAMPGALIRGARQAPQSVPSF